MVAPDWLFSNLAQDYLHAPKILDCFDPLSNDPAEDNLGKIDTILPLNRVNFS